MRVLVVEDEWKVADAIKEGLQAEHYDVVVERTGDDGYSRVTTETFDLMLLDLGLPGLGGLEVLTRLRKKQIDVPVLVTTFTSASSVWNNGGCSGPRPSEAASDARGQDSRADGQRIRFA